MDEIPQKSPQEVTDDLRAMVRVFARQVTDTGEAVAGAFASAREILDSLRRGLLTARESIQPLVATAKNNKLEANRMREVALLIEGAGWMPWIGAPFSHLAMSAEPVKEFELWLNERWFDILRCNLTVE